MAERPISDVVKSLGDDVTRLVRGEFALLKTELQHNLAKLGTGAGLLGGAGVVGLFALQFILLALMFGLIAMGLAAWISALIVGVLLGVIAAVMAMSGKKTVSSTSVAPTQAIDQMKTDAAIIKDDVDRLRRH